MHIGGFIEEDGMLAEIGAGGDGGFCEAIEEEVEERGIRQHDAELVEAGGDEGEGEGLRS